MRISTVEVFEASTKGTSRKFYIKTVNSYHSLVVD